MYTNDVAMEFTNDVAMDITGTGLSVVFPQTVRFLKFHLLNNWVSGIRCAFHLNDHFYTIQLNPSWLLECNKSTDEEPCNLILLVISLLVMCRPLL